MKTPTLGTEIKCTSQNFAFMNSPVPSVRLLATDDGWQVAEAGTKKGLIAYIRPVMLFPFDKVVGFRVTEVHPKVVFGEVILS